MSFGMPVNPELNPHSEKEEDDHVNGKTSNRSCFKCCWTQLNVVCFNLLTVTENINGTGGGELMAYNPTPNLLDFDDDIFLDTTSVTNTADDTAAVNFYNSDPLDLEDNKVSLLSSLTNDVNTSS